MARPLFTAMTFILITLIIMNSFGINAGVTRPFIEFLRLSLGWAIIFIIFLKVNLTVPERCWTGRAWLGSLFTQGTNMNHFLKRRGFLAGFWWDMGPRTISLPSALLCPRPAVTCWSPAQLLASRSSRIRHSLY